MRSFNRNPLTAAVCRSIAQTQAQTLFAEAMRELAELRQRVPDKPRLHVGVDLGSGDKTELLHTQ